MVYDPDGYSAWATTPSKHGGLQLDDYPSSTHPVFHEVHALQMARNRRVKEKAQVRLAAWTTQQAKVAVARAALAAAKANLTSIIARPIIPTIAALNPPPPPVAPLSTSS
jgi:hypothetical protein